MKKTVTITIILLIILGLAALTSCGSGNETGETKTAETSIAPGIQAPEGWPEDVPTPEAGEFIWGDWSPDQSFYTVDIRYTQAEIDAYAERLQDAGFSKRYR